MLLPLRYTPEHTLLCLLPACRSQLWGAALPLNTPGVECIYDPLSRVGVCGDWLMGSSMQAAVVSGIALAQRIAAARDTPVQQHASLALGLQEEFRPVQGAAFGQFPAAGTASGSAKPNVPVAANVASAGTTCVYE